MITISHITRQFRAIMSTKVRERKAILSKLDENRNLNVDGRNCYSWLISRARRISCLYAWKYSKAKKNVESTYLQCVLFLVYIWHFGFVYSCLDNLRNDRGRIWNLPKYCASIHCWWLFIFHNTSNTQCMHCNLLIDSASLYYVWTIVIICLYALDSTFNKISYRNINNIHFSLDMSQILLLEISFCWYSIAALDYVLLVSHRYVRREK
jgi:hypothetical protein